MTKMKFAGHVSKRASCHEGYPVCIDSVRDVDNIVKPGCWIRLAPDMGPAPEHKVEADLRAGWAKVFTVTIDNITMLPTEMMTRRKLKDSIRAAAPGDLIFVVEPDVESNDLDGWVSSAPEGSKIAFPKSKQALEREEMVRPEIKALCARGNITRAEVLKLHCNSWEWEEIFMKLDDVALVHSVKHALANCQYDMQRPWRTYNESVMGMHAPELVRRFELLLQGADRQRANAFADMLQIMADEQRQILSENASLRRKLEKMERKPE